MTVKALSYVTVLSIFNLRIGTKYNDSFIYFIYLFYSFAISTIIIIYICSDMIK